MQLEATEQLHSAITSAAPGLGMTADVLTQLFDKSLPTMIGMWDAGPLLSAVKQPLPTYMLLYLQCCHYRTLLLWVTELKFAQAQIPVAGLGAIPFIVHPIDESVHAVMNVSLRPAIKKFLCGPGLPSMLAPYCLPQLRHIVAESNI